MSQRILIIDDEAEIRRNLTFGLTQEGFTCTACPDGISAIHELHRSHEEGVGYNYLISDIFMPDIDGLKILKVIKSQFSDLPVLIITGFGDEMLESKALAEFNTGFLDKPFEISELVEALRALTPGGTTLDQSAEAVGAGEIREAMSAYLSIRISDPRRDMAIYQELIKTPGVVSCDAVRGDVDLICVLNSSSEEEMETLQAKIAGMSDLEVVSMSRVKRPKLDRDVHEFLDIYKKAVKAPAVQQVPKPSSIRSYVIIDIDKEFIQQVFTTLFFLDEVLVCDMVDDGTKLIGIISSVGAFGKTPKIIEKLSHIDGVLRVKQANIIQLMDM
ncbi:MAG: response regulator [Thermoanaerobaculales bacterium]|nr:response regulator [Thermoanaerobaculales bacterium]